MAGITNMHRFDVHKFYKVYMQILKGINNFIVLHGAEFNALAGQAVLAEDKEEEHSNGALTAFRAIVIFLLS